MIDKIVIYESLCYKDNRNPLYADIYDLEEEKPVPRNNCFCDNCFYGRDKLALEIIRLTEALEEIYSSHTGSWNYVDAELASERWEIAAKALGKI